MGNKPGADEDWQTEIWRDSWDAPEPVKLTESGRKRLLRNSNQGWTFWSIWNIHQKRHRCLSARRRPVLLRSTVDGGRKSGDVCCGTELDAASLCKLLWVLLGENLQNSGDNVNPTNPSIGQEILVLQCLLERTFYVGAYCIYVTIKK